MGKSLLVIMSGFLSRYAVPVWEMFDGDFTQVEKADMNSKRDILLLAGPKSTRPFFEQFLLAIIDAHSDYETGSVRWHKDREQRLAVASKALFDMDLEPGPNKIDDKSALYWMGRQRYSDLGRQTMKKRGWPQYLEVPKERSIRTLAKEAALIYYESDNASVIDRLRKAFSKQEEFWLMMARYHDDIPETLERQILESLKYMLSVHKIEMKL